MRRIARECLLAVFVSISVVACGGGGSSSGGGTANPHAGTYTGAMEYTTVIPGVTTETASVSMMITISADGTATITGTFDDGDVAVTMGRVDGDTLLAHAQGNDTFPDGYVCNGTEDWNGAVDGDAIEGTLVIAASCTGPNGTIPISANGTFRVTRAAGAAAPAVGRASGRSFLGAIAGAVEPHAR